MSNDTLGINADAVGDLVRVAERILGIMEYQSHAGIDPTDTQEFSSVLKEREALITSISKVTGEDPLGIYNKMGAYAQDRFVDKRIQEYKELRKKMATYYDVSNIVETEEMLKNAKDNQTTIKPKFALKATCWLKHGDHKKVLPISGEEILPDEIKEALDEFGAENSSILGMINVDIDTNTSAQLVAPGDWIIDKSNGGPMVIPENVFHEMFDQDLESKN